MSINVHVKRLNHQWLCQLLHHARYVDLMIWSFDDIIFRIDILDFFLKCSQPNSCKWDNSFIWSTKRLHSLRYGPLFKPTWLKFRQFSSSIFTLASGEPPPRKNVWWTISLAGTGIRAAAGSMCDQSHSQVRRKVCGRHVEAATMNPAVGIAVVAQWLLPQSPSAVSQWVKPHQCQLGRQILYHGVSQKIFSFGTLNVVAVTWLNSQIKIRLKDDGGNNGLICNLVQCLKAVEIYVHFREYFGGPTVVFAPSNWHHKFVSASLPLWHPQETQCDNLHPGEVHLVLKPNACVLRRMCTHLNKCVKVSYYNKHHTRHWRFTFKASYGGVTTIERLKSWPELSSFFRSTRKFL